MKSLRPLALVLALAFPFSGFPNSAPPTPPAAPNGSPAPTALALPAAAEPSLKVDPALRTGTLPNGLRYAIYPNKEPQGRASLRLVVQAGSLHETEEQRGLAHFLEHMAFNGSTNYPPGTLVEFFQRMGMSFGGDTNAFTSFDRTQYMLELPRTDEPTLAEGLRVLSDYAGGLLLLDEEIDRERGVILNEKRARDNVGYRIFVAQFGFMLNEARLPQRLPIGLEPVIEQARRDRFVDFWETWYRPERMIVVAVGDFDVAQVEAQIRETFTPLAAKAPARPLPDMGRVPDFQGLRVFYHHEPEAPSTTVSLTWLTPYADEPDSAQKRLAALPRDLALEILNRRFTELARKEGAPFAAGRAYVGDYFHFVTEAELSISTTAEHWSAALGVADKELRRALQFGFRPEELAEVVAEYRSVLEQAVRRAPTRHSSQLSNELAEALHKGEIFAHPEAHLELFSEALSRLTPEDCLAALRETFSGRGHYISVMGNSVIGDPGEPAPDAARAAIRDVYVASQREPVSPPEALHQTEWAYHYWGEPGRVVSDERVADLDLRLIRFANGVRLNLKKTGFEKGVIKVALRVGEGKLCEPAEQYPGIGVVAAGLFNLGGLGAHDPDELRRLLAGHTVSSGFRVELDAFTLAGETTRDDLQLQLQIMAAQLTDVGLRPEALRELHKDINQMYRGFAHTTNGPLATEVARFVMGGDPRFGLPPKEVLLSRTPEEAREWLTEPLAQGPLEVAIVGDFDPEATIAAVAGTLGALPPRRERRALDERKQVRFPEKPFNKNYRIPTEIDKGELRVYWPTTDGIDVQRRRRLALLGAVLNDRLRVKVREEIGGSYSPRAMSQASEVFPGYGSMQAACIVDPAQAGMITDLIVEIGDDLARNGVSADELERARQPVMTSIRESLRSNDYWLHSVLADAQEKPESLDWARTRERDFESITAEELSELARTYLGAARASRVIVLPEAK
ncbi:peptidase M16 [Cephaloticoccus primus]|uniref:Peptidase M16 n=1 Tax=Cephaloticoccus primus TaxID=1548207 RepID=A0A139ST73_9BACT|nr:insulinase family protein [Cephaloticoccus primus]KXU37714.1 peptidase M16 [Cephaloticoccus primus]